MHSTLRPLFLVLASIALATACSSSGTTTTAAPSVAAPVTPAPSAAAPSEAASGAPSAATGGETISLSTTALGDIIVDGEGKTLYAFTPDTAGISTCYEDCATAWPPLLADDPAAVSAGTGLDASKLSTVDRTDGTKQVKYGDWPLYHFAKDAAAGDTNGQGLFTKWYVVDATGAMVK